MGSKAGIEKLQKVITLPLTLRPARFAILDGCDSPPRTQPGPGCGLFAFCDGCGTEVSELFPKVAECVDDIALVRSMHTKHSNHYNATLGMHTGSFNFARPSIGSWVSYGLGSPNRNLPSFV